MIYYYSEIYLKAWVNTVQWQMIKQEEMWMSNNVNEEIEQDIIEWFK